MNVGNGRHGSTINVAGELDIQKQYSSTYSGILEPDFSLGSDEFDRTKSSSGNAEVVSVV